MVETTSDQVVRELSEENQKQKRAALFEAYTSIVSDVLDQLIAAYRPGIWKKGSDCDHLFCYHCRWYGDHPIRRRIEIELYIDDQCDPTGFKVLYHDHHGKCDHTDLREQELVCGIKAVFK